MGGGATLGALVRPDWLLNALAERDLLTGERRIKESFKKEIQKGDTKGVT